MGKLILVRHGHTPLNGHGQDERLRAWLDIPLDQQGLQEAADTAKRLRGYSVRAIFSSDLKRARKTAEIIRQATNADTEVVTTDELRPWNLGVFGGQLLREIIPFLNLLNEHPEMPAPNGESFHQFYDRYSRRLHAILKTTEETDGYVVAVTHVRNLLAAKTILTDGNRDRVPVQGGPSTGTLTFVENLSGTWKMCKDEDVPNKAIPIPFAVEQGHGIAVS
ncbi:MAG TPA: histidine phosphatase family protein [Candidatus Acidoferrales bacterium]|nr:histidine phosphatase family protein [Candidatus Acidoferrales bacterium]